MSDALQTLRHLDGVRFCMVCMEVLDAAAQKVKLTPIHGVARVLPGRLVVEAPSGTSMWRPIRRSLPSCPATETHCWETRTTTSS